MCHLVWDCDQLLLPLSPYSSDWGVCKISGGRSVFKCPKQRRKQRKRRSKRRRGGLRQRNAGGLGEEEEEEGDAHTSHNKLIHNSFHSNFILSLHVDTCVSKPPRSYLTVRMLHYRRKDTTLHKL